MSPFYSALTVFTAGFWMKEPNKAKEYPHNINPAKVESDAEFMFGNVMLNQMVVMTSPSIPGTHKQIAKTARSFSGADLNSKRLTVSISGTAIINTTAQTSGCEGFNIY